MSRNDIDCPGDIIPYECSIFSNSETLHLIWRVTIPGQEPRSIKYNNTLLDHSTIDLNNFVNAQLRNYEIDAYITATLKIILQAGILINQTKVECIIRDLGNDSLYVFVNTSSK